MSKISTKFESELQEIDSLSSQVNRCKFGLPLPKIPNLPDGEKYYLSNLVLQGGGTLGIAHVGFIYGLERADIRFIRFAGTSAGAIVALMAFAAKQEVYSTVADKLYPILNNMPSSSFIDGAASVRTLLRKLFAGNSKLDASDSMRMIYAVNKLRTRLGLNSGSFFENWLAQTLKSEFGLTTNKDLELKIRIYRQQIANTLPSGADIDLPPLRIMTTAMPVGLKLEFPSDLPLFQNVLEKSPAMLARTSMSVPLFFEPYQLYLNSKNWDEFLDNNQLLADFLGEQKINNYKYLYKLHFLDGGILSNFPIDAFIHPLSLKKNTISETTYNTPNSFFPTIGIALNSESAIEKVPTQGQLSSLVHHFFSTIDSLRMQRDLESFALSQSISNNSIKTHHINVNDHNWLNFSMSPYEIEQLFHKGLLASIDFLRKWGSS